MSDTRHSVIASPVGTLTLVAAERGLVAVLWPEERAGRVPIASGTHDPAQPVLAEAARQLRSYFAGELRAFDLPLAPEGTPFQRSVWRALGDIPYGATATYGDIATALGNPAATRAVGAANGRNPLSIVLPCHRVVGSSGALTGFAGGMAAKRWLLAHEARVTGSAVSNLPLFA